MRKEQYFVTHVLLWLCWTWPFCVASPTVCVDGGIELKGDGLALAWHKRVLCGESLHLSTRLDIFPSKAQIAAEAAGRAWLKRLWKSHSSQKGTVLYQMMEDILAPYSWGGSFAGGGTRIPFAIILFQVQPMFFLIVLQLCTCLHYWYVKIYWANSLQSEQTHVHTITLHAHDNIFGNDEVKSFYQTMLLRPCPTWSLMVHFFFMSFHFLLFLFFHNWLWTIDCGKAQSRSSIHSKPQQQPTLLFRHFVFLCFHLSVFLSKLE